MSHQKKNIVILGATSSIAEHCARLWTTQYECDFFLVGRNLEKLKRLAADIEVRNPKSNVEVIQADFNDPEKISTLARNISETAKIDIVLIAQGSLPDQRNCQSNLQLCEDTLSINGISPVLFAEAFASKLEKSGGGTLAVISSVAGDRGRKSNYVYGAAKGLVNRYVQGLQHRFANTSVKIILVKPGPTDTPMTNHLKEAGASLASVETVAKAIVTGIEKGRSVIYTPAKWRLIMMVVRHLPNFIFNKVNV